MDRVRGWFGGGGRKQQQPDAAAAAAATTPVLDLNASEQASLPSAAGAAADAAAAASQQAAAATAAAAAADADSQASSSSSESSSIPPAAGEPSTSSSQPQQQEDDDSNVNPMLHTSLTKRFKGRFEPLAMPTYESMMQEDFMNNCAVRSTIAGGMGGLLGVAFGVFTASLDTSGIHTAAGETKPTRVVLKETWLMMKDKSRSYAKGFAGMGFLYSGTECMIERYRAKHDAMNATLAGCATGGLMAAPGGAKAMCFGCASFAAFSTAIEYFTGGM